MLFLCICSLVSLHLHRSSVSSSGLEGSGWCVGRVNASSLQVCASIGGGDLDPAGCCKDKRQDGMVALDRIEGLFQCSLRASGSPGREQGGRTCARKVSGNLGVCFQECTENEGLKEDFLRVSVMTSRGQSSPQVNVSHDDLFTACSDWIWNTSEKHKKDVHASGLHLELSLEVSCRVSCTRFGPDRELVEEVCSARDGLVKDYSCCFAPQDKDGTETTRLHSSDRLKGSLVRVSSEERLLVLEFMLESQNNHSKEVHEDPSGPVMLCDQVIRIHTENQAYSTNTDITLLAVVDILDPVDFLWDFGDFTSARVNSRTVTKRYRSPGIYKLVVVAFWGQVSVRSKEFSLVVQRAVKLNRLVHAASVMQNHTVTVSCRVNVGTNLTFLWSFGDGTVRFGLSTEQHVFVRTGEFNIVVIASNLVSSASLSSYLFVVDRPCKPPPVKSLGPPKIQVRRHEVVRLGVSFDSDLNCSVSGELHYSWTLHDSAGLTVPLPVTSTHRQSLVLQSFTLQYGIYKATARVQIVGSVVYSNYTVRLQVVPSPVVVVILGGTNIYVNIKSSGEVTLDGRASYDPDFPSNPLRYSWTCQPVSTISSFCFNQSIPTSSPVLKFPMSLLKSNFDQFQFTLTVHSKERSASSEIFLTLSSHPTGKVSVHCPECQGDQVSCDQDFSVRAVCEDCNDSAEIIHFSWRLFLVNASSKPVTEIPFCYTVDLNAPSAVVENAFTSTSAPEKSPLTEDSSTSSRTPRVYQNSELTSPALSLTHGFSESITGIDHLFSNLPDQQNMFNEFQNDPESSGEWEFTFPSLESEDPISQRGDSSVPHVEEGDPGISSGRPKDSDIESFSPESDSSSHSLLHKDEGSNLVDPKPSLRTQKPGLLDLHRDLVDKSLFESYTHTGILFRDESPQSQRRFYGQTQLFLKTKPVPKDVACQVQPVRGKELLTHFSIFCTSGKEDLIYKYSFSVGGGTPRILYQGRDFQYYFSLPSGDPRDEHKVIIYTEIRSSMYGSATKLCPVTVRVEPSFLRNSSSSSSYHDPDLMISESGLRNVSVLVQLGNVAEIYNYISLLCSVLNRLSLDSQANTHALRHLRNVLICIVCKLGYSEQASAADSIFILNDLLHVQSQVTLQSARWVTAHVSAVSMQFSESNQNILRALVSLLSSSLQVVTSSPITSSSADSLESHPAMGKSRNAFVDDPYHCITDLSKVIYGKESESIPKKQMMRVVNDLLQTSSDLMLRNFVLQKTTELRVSSDLITLCAGFLNKTSTSIRCGSITFYLPASLIEMLLLRDSISAKRGFPQKEGPPCVHIIGMEFVHDPFRWGKYPVELDGPVADLSLYKCDSRRKIPVYSFIQPITVELDFPQKRGSTSEYTLLRSHINYHNFSITQEHLQQAVQVTVVFTAPSLKAFPVKLLFRMFERPTPSVHHLHRILNWGNNTILLTLPASYLSVAGVGHLALLDANFGKTPTRRHLTEQISYSLTVESSLCLSWDDQQGSWTQNGCRTLTNDRNSAVNCSCHQLKPIKVLKQQIQSSYFRDDLDQFLSAPRHLTVPFVLLFCVSLYIPVLVWCKKTDATSEENRRAHFLPDNSATDQHLYAVTVHTGLCSAARMSARVYIVLHGEDGRSQTKELHVPGCTLFTRNSQNTFILSAADSLGSVWGVHIWHNNFGPSPEWYLEQVQVSELMPGHVEGRSWHFIGQCWLAVHKGDGQVERMLRVSTHGLTFFKMLLLKLSEYLPDYHIWMSVYTCPYPHPFTRGQRLSVCLLLFLGHTCVNAVITSQLDDQLAFDLGVIDVTSVAIATGLVSAVAVLPVAMVISFLFRLQSGRLTEDIYYKNAFSKREPRGTKYQDTDLLLVSTRNLESKDPGDEEPIQPEKNKRNKDSAAFESIQELLFQEVLQVSRRSLFLKKSKTNDECELPPQNEAQHDQVKRRCGLAFLLCRCVAWTLCLLLSVSCLIISGVLGTRYSGMVLLWIHSLFVSLTFCIFVIHPAMVLCLAVIASWRFKKSRDFYCYFSKMNYHLEALKHQDADQLQSSDFTFTRVSNVEKLVSELGRLVQRKKERDLCLCGSMFVLMVCITYGSPVDEHYKINAALRRLFVGGHGSDFMSIKKHEEWWKWMQTSLLSILYHNESEITQMSYVLIGDPLVQKTEVCRSFSQVSMVTPPRPCYHIGSSSEQLVTVDLGFTRSEATSNLRLWHLSSWLSEQTVALKVQFTLYSPAPNLFSSVTLLSEKRSTGLFQSSSTVQSVRVYHSPSKLDYTVMLFQLLFLLLSLVNLYYQVFTAAQQGLMGSWKTTSFSVEVSLMIVSLLYYVHYVYRPVLVTVLAKQLRINPRGHVDVSALANLEQFSRTLRGIILFLLAVKCVTVLRVNRTLPPSVPLLSLASLLLPVISGLPLIWMFSCMGRLLYIERTFHSIQTVLWHFWSLQKPKGLICLWKDFYYFGFLFASSTMLTAMVFAVMIRKAKRSHKTKNLTIREVLGYVSQKFTGMNRQIADCHKQKIYFLEECESLVDELLFKLSALSNSLHHTLPPKLPTYTDENSPVASSTTELYKEKTQDFASSLTVGQGETTPTFSHVRPQFELQEVQHCGGSRGCKEAPKRFWREDNYESPDEHRTEKATRGGLGATRSHVVVVEALVHHEEGNLITKTSN
uniref:Polycystin-1-like protein 1 n=1 Tax=Oryzias melastigma TaxID=30732 RepID=A0A3B3C2D0_ORYME